MDAALMVVVFAFLIETVVEMLKPLLHRLDRLGSTLGVEMALLSSLA